MPMCKEVQNQGFESISKTFVGYLMDSTNPIKDKNLFVRDFLIKKNINENILQNINKNYNFWNISFNEAIKTLPDKTIKGRTKGESYPIQSIYLTFYSMVRDIYSKHTRTQAQSKLKDFNYSIEAFTYIGHDPKSMPVNLSDFNSGIYRQ